MNQVHDPAAVKVRQAATVMLVDDRPDLQVLMLRRDRATVFAGGMWVFPGGAVDPADDAVSSLQGPDKQEAAGILDLERGALAHYIAAIRECFEEAGVLLACHAEGGKLSDADCELATNRRRLIKGETRFQDFLAEAGLLADTSSLHYVARWITPQGPPRRFDARFFVARMPAGQVPEHDNLETTRSVWMSPAEILEREACGEMKLMSVTNRMVRCLAQFDSAGAVLQAATARLPDERVRVNPVDGGILLPGEPGYDQARVDVETGWVRLRPPANGIPGS